MNSQRQLIPPDEDNEWILYKLKFPNYYDESNYTKGLQAWAMNCSHSLLEKGLNKSINYKSVLEIGAGTGEHVVHVQHGFSEYILSDHDTKVLDAAQTKLSTRDFSSKLKYENTFGTSLDYPPERFDRLIAAHVLEHIPNPHIAIKEWNRVLKPGGLLSILIPTDPSISWRLARNLGPRKNALKLGIPYDYIMAREHVNSCVNLLALLRHYFPNSTESWWPLPIASTDFNLFCAFQAQKNETSTL